MILGKRQFLESEIAALKELISQTPEEDVIDRKSLEARKKKVETELSTLQVPYYKAAHGQLIFRGKPTIKSQGVYADFAASALDRYAKMITALGSSRTTELGSRGPIPKSEDFQLMITGTVLGSFGFEIEEAPKQATISSELSPVKAAMEKANLVMGLPAGSSDDDIANAIADMSARAIEAIRAFLEVMTDYEAVFAIELDDNKSLRFNNVEEIKRTKERLKPENIRETDMAVVGEFRGALPDHRSFEFWIEDRNEMIFGKVGPEIEDVAEINRILYKPARIQIHTRQVGTSRPRYTLNTYEEIVQ